MDKIKEIIDISMPVSYDMPVYKGREAKRPVFSVDSDFKTGTAYESSVKINFHTGTHVDASLHMVPEGETVKSLKVEDFITECKVIDMTCSGGKITKSDLISKEILKGDFILLKTKNSFEDILEGEFIYLAEDGAEYLAELGVKGVGIDGLGIERNQPEHRTHLSLMEIGAHIIEGLRLADVEEGRYTLIALPLNIPEAEASPVRAVLVR